MAKTDPEASRREHMKTIKWVVTIFFVTIMISGTISLVSDEVMANSSVLVAFLILLAIIFLGIVFDIIGVAVTAAVEVPFRAMAAKKVKGAKESIILINNADKVSSIIADILGDICSILSGAAGAVVTAKLISGVVDELAVVIIASVVSATIAGVIIFGKAMGKRIALDNCDNIVLMLGKIVYVFTFGKLSIKNKN